MAIDHVNHLGDFLFGELTVDQVKGHIDMFGQIFAQQHAARRGFHADRFGITILIHCFITGGNLGMKGHHLVEQSLFNFLKAAKHHAFARFANLFRRHVIQPQNNILGRHDDRFAVGGAQNVVGGHHQHTGFKLRFQAERHVNGHLVPVKVGVKRGADQRMQLDRLAFDQDRFKGLNAKAVQRWRPVQHDRVFADHRVQNVPNLAPFFFHQLLGLFDGGRNSQLVEPCIDKRLEQLQGHFLWQTALMQQQFRPDHDYRTSGIVHAFPEQVLTEPALFPLQHIRQGFQRPLVGPGNHPATPTVVKQSINRFLQHAFFVPHNNVRRPQFHQPLQAVVPVDHPTIQIIQVGSGEPPAIQRHQRAQLWRDNRQHVQDHPFGFIAGFQKPFNHLQALDDFLRFQFRFGFSQFPAQVFPIRFKINIFQQNLDGFRPDAGGKAVLAVLLLSAVILLLTQQLLHLQRRKPRLDHNILLKIQYPLQILQSHVQDQANAAGKRFQEPDMRDRRRQVNMAHAVTAHLAEGHFHTTFFAGNAAIFHALVFAAKTFIVLDRAKNTRTEQAILFRLESPVVNGFRFFDLAVRPRPDLFRTCNGDPDIIKGLRFRSRVEEIHNFLAHNLFTPKSLPV